LPGPHEEINQAIDLCMAIPRDDDEEIDNWNKSFVFNPSKGINRIFKISLRE
jgi:hypothetical protein